MARTSKSFDQWKMLECLLLAERGWGHVSPNPMVGALVVKNGKVVGRGYHRRFGGPHAEVYAIRQAGSRSIGATLYVNLEPCCYYGKTPPCTDLIKKAGIKRVVVGMKDPNPLVHGKGIRILRSSHIQVEVGILKKECEKLNEVFVKYVTVGLPFITLKIAQTLDGKIADVDGNSRWITNEHSRTIVHALRARNDAILVGANTVRNDNPLLTVRSVKGRNPLRVVLDGNLRISPKSKLFSAKEGQRTIVFTSLRAARRNRRTVKQLANRGVDTIALESRRNNRLGIHAVMKILANQNVSSVLVEGGAQTYAEFLRSDMVDKCIMFVSPKILGEGLSTVQFLKPKRISSAIVFDRLSSWNLRGDIMIEAYVRKSRLSI